MIPGALAVLFAAAAGGLAVQLLDGRQAAAARTGADGSVYVVPISGTIEMGLAPFVARSIREAEAASARAVVLDIETPGGRIDAAQQIVDALRATSIPTFAFVNRRAFSAGAMISLAADDIYMRPGGVIGAATPVTGQGEKASEKIVSAMRSEMRALAEDRGLDPVVAEAMVDEDIEIEGLVAAGKLLTLTAEEADRIGYATLADDLDAVLARAGLDRATVHRTETNWAESIVRLITHPIVAPMLLSLGFLGVIIEIKTPTFGLAGGLGLASLGLFFGGHYITGLAGLEEVILLIAGIALLAAEAFIIPGFGIAGILGLLAVVSGIFLSMVGNFSTAAELSQAAGVLGLTGLVVIIAAWALIRRLPRSGRFARSGLLLGEATSRETGYLSADTRTELVGATGVAVTDLRPAGAARFGDERIDVVAESNWINAGTPVRIVRSEGYRHVVQVAEAQASTERLTGTPSPRPGEAATGSPD
ncbi:MAG: NfeD family protein [Longimicrobiales bacterium]